jgi:hypothetical protein
VAGAGEDRRAVGVAVAVDQLDRLVEAVTRTTPSTGRRSRRSTPACRRDVVQQRRADPEAVAVDVELAAVDDDVRLVSAM